MRGTPRTYTTSWLIRCSWLCATASTALACSAAVDAPRVDFGVSEPIGRWEVESAQSRLGDASVQVVTEHELGSGGASAAASGSATAASSSRRGGSTQSGASKAATSAAGHDSSMTAAANGGAGGGSASAGPAMPVTSAMGAAGSAADSGNGTPRADKPTAVTGVTFSYATEPVGGRYKPKNIGAVWICDSSGKLIKSLEVWAYVRLRYLTKYASVRAGARPDVTASATLPNHSKAHMASWDLKDTSGATVTPGKYTLNAELTDQDATGKSISVDFDTSAGSMTLTPPNSTGFTKLELVLK